MTPEEMKRNWAEQDRIAVLSAYQELIKSYSGRKFLWHLLQLGKVGTQPFSTNSLTMSFACGELNVGNGILADLIEAAPDGYVLLQKEMSDEHRNRSTNLDRADAPGYDPYA